jgi:hypothetical protein
MGTNGLGSARDRAQDALSEARNATDPEIKRHWLEIAEAWMRVSEALVKAGQPPTARKPRIVINNPR